MASKEKSVVIIVSLAVVLFFACIMYFQPPFFKHWIIKLESDTYDRQVRRFHKPLGPHPSIVIVDVDDRAIAEEGRWPWSRDKIAKLTEEISRLGAKVIALDMVFSEKQKNPVDAILQVAPQFADELKQIQPLLDADTTFAQALKKGRCVLGFAFTSNGRDEGSLPPPLLSLTQKEMEQTLILPMDGYVGNLPLFQQAAPHGGFINAMIDSDGILRFSPLVMRKNEKVYPSLALQAAQLFLSAPFNGIVTSTSGDHRFIEAVQLGDITIPTDPWGRILVPFRGPPFTFPYISATDVLQGKIKQEQVKGKLVFVGVSATASSDLIATAISPVFPGTEVQATIASGIIDNYLPYKPNWGRGGAIGIVLVLGALASFLFPSVSHLAALFFSIFIIAVMEAINYWLWISKGVALSFFFPTPTIASIFIFDLVSSFVTDRRRSKKKKQIFGRHVSHAYLERLSQKDVRLALEGENRELTILCVTLRDLAPSQLAEKLDHYFHQISQMIHDQNGVLGECGVGQIFAFWGAPLSEPKQALLSLQTALAIQEKSKQLNWPITIAVTTGTAYIGAIGSKSYPTYMPVGKPVDRVTHLQNLARADLIPIVVDGPTWQQTKEAFVFKKLDQAENLYQLLRLN